MEVNKKGGKRKGAGRKPTDNPKETVSLYVEKKTIWKFGNKDKLKEKIYGFIAADENAMIGNSDAGLKNDEAGQFQQPAKNTSWDEPNDLPSFQTLLNGMSDIQFSDEKEEYAEKIKAASHLSEKQRGLLLTNLWNNK